MRQSGMDLNAMFIELYAGGGIPNGVVLKDGSGVNAASFLDRSLLDESGNPILAWDSSGIYIPQEQGISNPNWSIDGPGNASGLNLADCTGYDLSASGPNNGTDGSGLDLYYYGGDIGSGNGLSGLKVNAQAKMDGLLVGDGIGLFGIMLVDAIQGIRMNLPTSDPLVEGALWNLAGVVQISAG